jgi:hypothetical protein
MDSNSYIVKKTKAHGSVMFGVVPWRTYDGERISNFVFHKGFQ